MFNINQNEPVNESLNVINVQPDLPPINDAIVNQFPEKRFLRKEKQLSSPSSTSRSRSLHLPAIILFAFTWILQAIATFIPYWSTYSGVSGSRAGLWSARNFNFWSIQNFYFPQPNDFPTLTDSIRFTRANTKGYLVTVQFLMTFNFVTMLIVLVLLVTDYIIAHQPIYNFHSFLIGDYNTSDTLLKYGLLLYILYVFIIFEFAAWITYVGSRHDDNWLMHVSFAFAVIVSVFLIVVFVMYTIEFMKRSRKNRSQWRYWYGPYIEWGLFVFITGLLFLLIVICCPEWAYLKIDSLYVFAELGLFKQCFLSSIYSKSLSNNYCTLSNTSGNHSWVNATQAFMLMAYIFGMILLLIIFIFRKEFRHNESGYYSDRVSQPTFTFVMAGLILFFCFIFSLIAIAIFGSYAFPELDVNWGYIIAVFAVVLFFIAGILFILDGIHSKRQSSLTEDSSVRKFFLPARLDLRALNQKPITEKKRPEKIQPMFNFQQPEMQQIPNVSKIPFYKPEPMMMMNSMLPNDPNVPFYTPEQMMMMNSMPPDYSMEQDLSAPLAQAIFTDYFRQMQNNPQILASQYNRSLLDYSGNNPQMSSSQHNTDLINYLDDNSMNNPFNRRIDNDNDLQFNDLLGKQMLQLQHLNRNHERLLARYARFLPPDSSQFPLFGTSSLPGRNYDDYLDMMHSDQRPRNPLVELSRAGIGSSNETQHWLDNESFEPLERDINSTMNYRRNGPTPYVDSENVHSRKPFNGSFFKQPFEYIRSLFKQLKYSNNELKLNSFDHNKNSQSSALITHDNDHGNTRLDKISTEYLSYQDWKIKQENYIPIDSFLFNIYIQRLNGCIQSYGQSLYLFSGYYAHDQRIISNEDTSVMNSSKLNCKDFKLDFQSLPEINSTESCSTLSSNLCDQHKTFPTSSKNFSISVSISNSPMILSNQDVSISAANNDKEKNITSKEKTVGTDNSITNPSSSHD